MGRQGYEGDNDGVPKSSAPATTVARNRLVAVGTFGAIGLSLSGMYAVSGIGVPCPWRYLTGTLCPLCGSTTLGAHLLRGDFAAAWAANQFVFLLLAGLLVATAFWTVESLGGPSWRLPVRSPDNRLWWALLVLAGVAFAVVRNLVPLA
jgi:hypothetical protein